MKKNKLSNRTPASKKKSTPTDEQKRPWRDPNKPIYIGLIVLGTIMYMSFFNFQPGLLMLNVFTSWDGILILFKEFGQFLYMFFVRADIIYIALTLFIMYMVLLPLFVRYKIIQVRTSPLLAVVLTLYLFVILKYFGLAG